MGSEELSAGQKITSWLSEFDTVLQDEDVDQILELFDDQECFWRDLLPFTWNIETFESKDEILKMLTENLARVKPRAFVIDGDVIDRPNGLMGSAFKFETSLAWCRGFVWLKGGKCWTITTSMWDLKGYEEKISRSRPFGPTLGQIKGRKTAYQEKQQEQHDMGRSKQPYCLVVGAGQGGVMLGARLRMLGVPAIIVEKNERLGDNWRNRYKSLALHTPCFSDHYPYLPFPSNWPVLAPKEKLADFIECYGKLMDLNVWCSTECKSASYDEKEGHWTVVLERKCGSEVSEVVVHPSHVVLACGLAGYPKMPSFPGKENFQGVQIHSSKFVQGEDYTGKKCIIIGAGTSAHDICLDLWEQGASEITLVQKSHTHIVTMKDFLESRLDPQLEKAELDTNFDTDAFDLKSASLPYKVLPRLNVPIYARIAQKEAELYDKLHKAGFKTFMGEDESGLILFLLRRAAGYYIDMGASELIADGEVRVKNGVTVQAMKENSVVFDDGSEVSADVIIYATGYGNMQEFVEKLISKEAAEKVGLCWGLGSGFKGDPGPWVGELKNMYRPLPVPALWILSGGLSHCRFYSRHVALQLKARMEGIPTPVYKLVRHKEPDSPVLASKMSSIQMQD
ncbi:hypothetical protein MPTK1_2g16380 [Marchantia polymorpha subsp. ruderalis]|uniref:Flavin-containing monooxygenase n=1 Tax=Marchantia polymorpha TaxID=3197 RepID=A0A2R6W9R8_MARPO|nr:hypothetical protein MARPO_0122s0026 [Marchantia polymorpha]BBN02574.1 hypothetical protein Mp_2g16380 [Marchantia polymorpha subsp. ruderalis]|eukprot:PTQ30595.1 hypothetical protein MARPO_0122s0026 [Marchantia polymorpha]